jgi:hypothetical protein
MKVDVHSYQFQLSLFNTAFTKHGCVDTAIFCARIIVQVAGNCSLNGISIFVGGGCGFDTEEGIEQTEPQ